MHDFVSLWYKLISIRTRVIIWSWNLFLSFLHELSISKKSHEIFYFFLQQAGIIHENFLQFVNPLDHSVAQQNVNYQQTEVGSHCYWLMPSPELVFSPFWWQSSILSTSILLVFRENFRALRCCFFHGHHFMLYCFKLHISFKKSF